MGHAGALVLWTFVCFTAFFVCQTALQAASRTIYAFSRDHGLPDRGILSKNSSLTQTPLIAIWFTTLISVVPGLLDLASPIAANAIFALTAMALDLSYIIPIFLWVDSIQLISTVCSSVLGVGSIATTPKLCSSLVHSILVMAYSGGHSISTVYVGRCSCLSFCACRRLDLSPRTIWTMPRYVVLSWFLIVYGGLLTLVGVAGNHCWRYFPCWVSLVYSSTFRKSLIAGLSFIVCGTW